MLYNEPEDFTKPSPEVERMSRGEGRFIMVRIRNKTDLAKFADLLGTPHLKAMKKHSVTKLKWSIDSAVNEPLLEFF